MKSKKMDFQIIYFILSYAVWGMFWGGWGVLLPVVKSMLGASEAVLGRVLMGVPLGAIPAMLVTGLVIKKFTKWALFSILLFFASGIAAITFINSPLSLGVILFFVGAASGMLDVIMNSGVAALESLTDKHYFNYAHAAFPIAVIITSPAVGFIRQQGIEFRTILLVMAGIVALVGFLSLNLEVSKKIESKSAEDKQKVSSSKLLITRTIFAFGSISLLVHVMEKAVEQWSAIYLEESLLALPTTASLGLTGYMALLFIGRMIAQKINNYWTDKSILTYFTLTAVFGFLIVSAVEKPVFVIMGFSLAGLGIAPVIPMVFSLAGKAIAGDKRVKAISSITVIGYTGYLLSPPLIGYLASIFSLRTAWFILSIIALLLVIMIRIIFTYAKSSKKADES